MEKELEGFLRTLASSAPVPEGGGAAALAGALGIALGNMVGNLTLGKKKYAAVQEDILALNTEAEELRRDFIALIEEDALAFEPLSRAYGIAKDDPAREEILETALKRAAGPPLKIMEKCARALELIAEYGEKGSALAVSDAGCAAALTLAAMKSAALNVRINTGSMTDGTAAGEMNARADKLLMEYGKIAEEIYENVSRRLA